jgi:hypothetical protein
VKEVNGCHYFKEDCSLWNYFSIVLYCGKVLGGGGMSAWNYATGHPKVYLVFDFRESIEFHILPTRSGRERKISPPPRFDARTVHPVASRYTDCAIPTCDPVRMGAENLAPTGIRSPACPQRSESLYRLHHPDPFVWCLFSCIWFAFVLSV